MRMIAFGVLVIAVVVAVVPANAEPPFMHDGLPYLWPGLITADDPSSLQSVTDAGRADRLFWESYRWRYVNVHLFNVQYPGITIEFHVHPDMRSLVREQKVEEFALMLGRLPAVLLRRVRAVSIDVGYQTASANGTEFILHSTERMTKRLDNFYCGSRPGTTWCGKAPGGARGALEETYIHEAGHLFDDEYGHTRCWLNAQRSDGEFISRYARDNPGTVGDPGGEDFADSLLAYFALRYRPGRLDPAHRRLIRKTIPARIRCMDRWGLGAERPD